MFNLVLKSLGDSDSCNVWLNQVVVCALPSNASRHNSTSHPNVLKLFIKSHLPAGNACIVVRNKEIFITTQDLLKQITSAPDLIVSC